MVREEYSQYLRAWLEIFRLLVHAWSLGNLRKIGNVWGLVAGLNKRSEEGTDFSPTKALIDTC